MNKGLSFRAGWLAAACGLGALCAAPAVAEPVTKPAPGGSEIVGMRRLTEAEYRRAIADVFGPDIKIQGRFEPAVRREGLIAIGSAQASISSSGMEQYYSMASGISAQILGADGRKKYLTCQPVSAQKADDACAGKFIAQYGRMLYRRPLETGELKALVNRAHKAATDSRSFQVGLEETLTSMLTSPHFLFRIERSENAQGAPILDGYSRASRLSFLFWDASPDNELLQAAEKGELSTQAGLAKQVDRLASSPRLSDGLSAFFDDMLQMDLFRTQTKDPARFPKYSQVLVEDSRQQTLRTLLDLLVTKNGDYRDIFTTRDTFLTRNLAMVYNVPYTSNAGWSPYTFKETSGRAGVLTQVSFLSLFSHPAQSSPTKRGVALNEIFLCQAIPTPPADVDFTAVNGSGPDRKPTARARLEMHRNNPSCSACHSLMDPPGLMLEKFDALGQSRENEDGFPIDVKSVIAGHAVEGATGLGQMMHDDPAAPACLVRNLFSTGAGRAPVADDYKIVSTLTKAFADGGYRVPAFLRTAAKSDSFFALTKSKPQKETRQ